MPANFVESNFVAYPTECPPGISELNDIVITEDSATPALNFTVSDVETAAVDLPVTASSSNLALVPPGAVVLTRQRTESLGAGDARAESLRESR